MADETAVPGREEGWKRPELVEATATRDAATRVSVTCHLRFCGRSAREVATGTGDRAVELRLAVEATLTALRQLLPAARDLECRGVKSMRAFDAELILVSLWKREEASTRLLGAVPAEESRVMAAARATLDAANRVLARPCPPDAQG